MSDFDYGKTKPDGQHERYPVEVKPVYVQPIRNQYKHDKCGVVTRCGQEIARTYASNPSYYGATFCAGCHGHFPLAEFTWLPDGLRMTEVGGPAGADWSDTETVPPPPEPEWKVRLREIHRYATQATTAIGYLHVYADSDEERERIEAARQGVEEAVAALSTRIKMDAMKQ